VRGERAGRTAVEPATSEVTGERVERAHRRLSSQDSQDGQPGVSPAALSTWFLASGAVLWVAVAVVRRPARSDRAHPPRGIKLRANAVEGRRSTGAGALLMVAQTHRVASASPRHPSALTMLLAVEPSGSLTTR